MNERIKKLIEQATDIVEVVNPDTGITHHREFFDKEKFAELIVRECAKIADDGCGSACFGLGINGAMLLQHFGVEE
jgi:hypothetical protein